MTRDITLGNLLDYSRLLQTDEERYLAGLKQFLRARRIRTILDACGGTGFPALALAQAGWRVTYADGSEDMLGHFIRNLREQDTALPRYLAKWGELREKIDGAFDLVICRGNSLVYIDSWGSSVPDAGTPLRMRKAVEQFYAMLNPGGLLYIDIYNRRLDGAAFSKKVYGPQAVAGNQVTLISIIEQQAEQKLRLWRPSLQIGEDTFDFELASYLLTHAELVDLLGSAGFVDIRETRIEGEDFFTVYTARKNQQAASRQA